MQVDTGQEAVSAATPPMGTRNTLDSGAEAAVDEFVVGAKATIMKPSRTGTPEPVGVHTVARLTKLFIELDDGSRWSLDDLRAYPKNMRARFEHRRPFVEPGGDLDVQRRVDAKNARASIEARCATYGSRETSPRYLGDQAALQILAIWDADIARRKNEEAP